MVKQLNGAVLASTNHIISISAVSTTIGLSFFSLRILGLHNSFVFSPVIDVPNAHRAINRARHEFIVEFRMPAAIVEHSAVSFGLGHVYNVLVSSHTFKHVFSLSVNNSGLCTSRNYENGIASQVEADTFDVVGLAWLKGPVAPQGSVHS
ncbi:hypothetical protein BpHYR1_007381 [Brachionus plicatilis]|uniref:Uncharacterized protein n=1 Tax=Brachionus plicatilis TaxID=10195 RepID=A0A3M7P0V0_BRAPC|nr:hypothetical protein BpHYR1_007381 [Brachionus plicatilis]